MPEKKTHEEILDIARDLLASGGVASVSFDAIARRLGRTKQAVLYWYPTKNDLLAAMFLPWLEAEADRALRSMRDASTRDGVIDAFVRSIAAFHLEDLDRFRMMYLVPQTLKPVAGELRQAELLTEVHPVTDRMYRELAEKLGGGDPVAARRDALSVHSAVLGLVLMFGLADSLNDPLKHGASELIDALVAALTSGDSGAGR